MFSETRLNPGSLCEISNGYLHGCGEPIFVGPVMCWLDERGRPRERLTAQRLLVPTFEIAKDIYGGRSVSDSVLKQQGATCVEEGIEAKRQELHKSGAADVWCAYRQRMTWLRCDDPKNRLKGWMTYVEVAMFGTSLCLLVKDEVPA